MQSQTAKMIYPNQLVADMICQKLNETAGKHIVMKVSTGYQVCPVQVLQGYTGPTFPTLKTVTDAPAAPQTETGDVLTLTIPFQRETKAWIFFEDKHYYALNKCHPISWEVKDGMAIIRLPKNKEAKFLLQDQEAA